MILVFLFCAALSICSAFMSGFLSVVLSGEIGILYAIEGTLKAILAAICFGISAYLERNPLK